MIVRNHIMNRPAARSPARRSARLLAALLAAAVPAVLPAATTLPEQFPLGRDANGERCTASRNWQQLTAGIGFAGDQGHSINCGGVAAARAQGYLDAPEAPTAIADAACGAAQSVTITGLGAATARQCLDPRLGVPVIDLVLDHQGRSVHAVATATALVPLEAMLRTALTGAAAPAEDARGTTSIEFAKLAPVPVTAGVTGSDSSLRPEVALVQGLTLIHAGRHVEASRLLNDAVSEAASAPALVQAELRLNAGLADSNIRQFEAARGHFVAAKTLIATAPASDAKVNLEQQAQVYTALDALNRQRADEALAALDAAGSGAPLTDPTTLSQLNQTRRTGAAATDVASSIQLAALLIEARGQWARSIARLTLDQAGPARTALAAAVDATRQLQRSVRPDAIGWLRAGMERQNGRILARSGDLAGAVAAYDCAIITLQGGRIPVSARCLFTDIPDRDLGRPAGPTVIAETQLERAALQSRRPGVNRTALLAEFGAAIDTLAAQSSGGSAPPALAGYLDLLIRSPEPTPAEAEAYFRALQTVGEPAVAREFARLQSVVASDSAVRSDLRDRDELEREVIRLRYQISAAAAGDPGLADLEARRQAAEAARTAVNARLLGSQISAVDDQPVEISRLRQVLRPGEAYLKLAEVGGGLYGIVITAEATSLYRSTLPASAVNAMAQRVLASARSGYVDPSDPSKGKQLRPFAVAESAKLFDAITGPARPLVLAAQALVLDPVGDLRNLPAAVLVTDAASVETFIQRKKKFDYTPVAFLAQRSQLSTSLSARSLVVTRERRGGEVAPRPFLGLGENAIAPVDVAAADRTVQLGPTCRIRYGEWATIQNNNVPISARELTLAADALGVPGAPSITGAAFTDTALLRAAAAGDLAQYQILHFATHGLPATPAPGQIDCTAGLPPALLTSLLPPSADGGAVADGLLSFDDIARLRLNANLVFLSACETSTGVSTAAGRLAGQEDSAPSLDGLVRAFLAANARAVVATAWAIPDGKETNDLIAAFYRNGRTAPIADSLAMAQRTIITQRAFSHPYFWGAFFVVGDGARPLLTPVPTGAGR